MPAAAATRFHVNPRASRGPFPEAFHAVLSLAAARACHSEIARWEGYRPTPLVSLPLLAEAIGVARISYKQEAGRFGLGSFKALGGAYAVSRLLADVVREATGETATSDDLASGRFASFTHHVTVTCATDGNHGRSVAWGASRFGCRCVIFVHETVSEARVEAIGRFGAEVVRCRGNYDDSVREADRVARANGWRIVSDTSYPGYVDVPRHVMQGYSVMIEEIVEQAPETSFSHVFVQGGVGGLAAAVTATFWERLGRSAPRVVVVEPLTAACLLESAEAGGPVPVGGDLETIMAGLACGEPSLIAWPILDAGAAAFMAIADDAAADTMRLLASGAAGARLVGGESGVAGLAGLRIVASRPDWREGIGLDAGAHVLVIGSEGDTDSELYRRIVGVSATEIREAT